MARSEFKPGDTVRVVREVLPELPMGSVHVVAYMSVGFVYLVGGRGTSGRSTGPGWFSDRFELVELVEPPTINPDEWTEFRSVHAWYADDYESMWVLCAWTLTNLAPVLLAGWAHRDPEPTVMVELPRDVAEFAAELWLGPWFAARAQVVGRACKAALEQEARNG